jgi:hypothetical protein
MEMNVINKLILISILALLAGCSTTAKKQTSDSSINELLQMMEGPKTPITELNTTEVYPTVGFEITYYDSWLVSYDLLKGMSDEEKEALSKELFNKESYLGKVMSRKMVKNDSKVKKIILKNPANELLNIQFGISEIGKNIPTELFMNATKSMLEKSSTSYHFETPQPSSFFQDKGAFEMNGTALISGIKIRQTIIVFTENANAKMVIMTYISDQGRDELLEIVKRTKVI